jgi:leucyl-tRNA synthetase
MQKNLKTDFLRIALTHREEITKLLEWHEEQVRTMNVKMEAVAALVIPAAQGTDKAEDEAESEDEESGKPSILGVLNED